MTIFKLFNSLSSLWQGAAASTDQRQSAGLEFNVDGTPMLNDAVDVLGKAYGVSDSGFNHDHGGTFDAGMGSSTGSDW